MSEVNMTKEEALKRVDGYLTLALGSYLPIDNCEEVDEILKTLKQESRDDKMKVLEKIKEEISHLVFKPYEGRDMLDRQEVLDVIEREQFKGDAISETEIKATQVYGKNEEVDCFAKEAITKNQGEIHYANS